MKKLGWKILERNWKYSRIGEIDIIAKEKDTIVFVEVKFRRSNKFGSAVEAITPKKLEKIYTSAMAYLNDKKPQYKNYRIDIIAIDHTSDKDGTPGLNHYKNVSL